MWFNYTTATMSPASARTVVANLLGANVIAVDTPNVTNVAAPTGRRLSQVDTKDYPSIVVDVNTTSATNWEGLNAQYTATKGATVEDLRRAGAVHATAAEGYVIDFFRTPETVTITTQSTTNSSSYDVIVYITLTVGLAVVARMAAGIITKGKGRRKDGRGLNGV